MNVLPTKRQYMLMLHQLYQLIQNLKNYLILMIHPDNKIKGNSQNQYLSDYHVTLTD